MHVNLVHRNSMHTTMVTLPTFSGQTLHVHGENLKTRTNNLHYQKTRSVAVILSLRVQRQHIKQGPKWHKPWLIKKSICLSKKFQTVKAVEYY